MMHESLLKGSIEYEELFCGLVIILNNMLTRYRTLREVGPEDVLRLERCQEAVDFKVGTLRSNLVQWISFFSRIPASLENKVNLATLLLSLHSEVINYLTLKVLYEGIFARQGENNKGEIEDFIFTPTHVWGGRLDEIEALLEDHEGSQSDIYQIFRKKWAQSLTASIAAAVTLNPEAAHTQIQEVQKPFQGYTSGNVA